MKTVNKRKVVKTQQITVLSIGLNAPVSCQSENEIHNLKLKARTKFPATLLISAPTKANICCNKMCYT